MIPELRIMTSQTELPTLNFFSLFELVTRCERKFNVVLDLTLKFYFV